MIATRSNSQVLNRFQRGSAGISSLVFSAGIDGAEQGPHLIVGGGKFRTAADDAHLLYAISIIVFLACRSNGLIVFFCYAGTIIDDSGLYETKSVRDPTIKIEREYVGYDLDGPAKARLVAGGPALVAISKEGGILRFSSNLGISSA